MVDTISVKFFLKTNKIISVSKNPLSFTPLEFSSTVTNSYSIISGLPFSEVLIFFILNEPPFIIYILFYLKLN